MIINKDFKEFFQSLNNNKVKYLVIGGYAVAFHGYPRYTKDIDIWIGTEKTNAINLINALDEFGFSSLGLKPEDFLDPNNVVQLGNPPNRIDILCDLDGVEFDQCFNNRIIENIEGTPINFIDIINLKKNKKACGRLQDLADLEQLNENS